MDSPHFGIRSGKRGAAAEYFTYITRQARHASRGDLGATGFGNMPDWAKHDPSLLWKASDRFERKNGSTFRSFTIGLPSCLTNEQLVDLAWNQALRFAGSKPFQFALHLSHSALSGEFNPHGHIMLCDRLPDGIPRSPEAMFKRYNPKDPKHGGCRKDSGGASPTALKTRLLEQREEAVETTNQALEQYGHVHRFDHRSLKDRGIDRAPERYLGPAKVNGLSAEERKTYKRRRRDQRKHPRHPEESQ